MTMSGYLPLYQWTFRKHLCSCRYSTGTQSRPRPCHAARYLVWFAKSQSWWSGQACGGRLRAALSRGKVERDRFGSSSGFTKSGTKLDQTGPNITIANCPRKSEAIFLIYHDLSQLIHSQIWLIFMVSHPWQAVQSETPVASWQIRASPVAQLSCGIDTSRVVQDHAA